MVNIYIYILHIYLTNIIWGILTLKEVIDHLKFEFNQVLYALTGGFTFQICIESNRDSPPKGESLLKA